MKLLAKGLTTIMKAVLGLLLILLVTPIVYFAWRAGQPMRMPVYDRRTYYEMLTERRQTYVELADTYQTSHPGIEVKSEMCFQVEVLVILTNTMPWSGICAISELIPVFRVYGEHSRQLGCGQMGASWADFLSTWWLTFETLLYKDILVTAPQNPVSYCRILAP